MSARGQALSFSWELSRRGTQSNRAPKNLPIFGKRRKCGKPNSRASFILQATSDEVVGFSRLTLLDCLTTWVYLDNTRTRMRVLFYMVICASFYLDYRLFNVRSFLALGEKFLSPLRVINQLSSAKTFLRPLVATSDNRCIPIVCLVLGDISPSISRLAPPPLTP